MNVIITPPLVGFKVYSLILLPASFSHARAQEQLKYRSSVRKMEHLTSKNLHGRRCRERHITADVPEKNPVLASFFLFFKYIYIYWQQRDGRWCHHLHKWSLRRKKKWNLCLVRTALFPATAAYPRRENGRFPARIFVFLRPCVRCERPILHWQMYQCHCMWASTVRSPDFPHTVLNYSHWLLPAGRRRHPLLPILPFKIKN